MQIGIYRFDRMEVSGSLGDLGTLLPLAVGMIMINGLDPVGLFFAVGLFYILAGLYYRVPIAVQPMKTIGAYAVAMGVSAQQVSAAGLLMGVLLLAIAMSGFAARVMGWIHRPVVRGVQVATGTLLTVQGLKLMAGTSTFQATRGAAEPFLAFQKLWFLPLGLALGVLFAGLTLFLLDNRKAPAGLVVVLGGLLVGLAMGTREGFEGALLGLHLPSFLPFGAPTWADFATALFVMTLPQTPMTLGNAVVANEDLSNQYFPEGANRVTAKALCVSMALANFLSFAVGGMPMCHGAGGLAAHYRFGARTAGSNLIIGLAFLALAVFLGPQSLAMVRLIPMAVLGVLLVFAGTGLCLTLLDVKERKDMFIVFTMLGLTLAWNLAVAFAVGAALSFALKSDKLQV